MAKRTLFKIFEIIGNKVDIEVIGNNISNIQFRYFKPDALNLNLNKEPDISYAPDTTFIKFYFKGGTSNEYSQIIQSPPKPANLNYDFEDEKVVMNKFIEIQFEWNEFDDEKIDSAIVPETSGKSVLVSP